MVTSRGQFDIKGHRDWAPHGADRLHHLTQAHYYDGVRFFRVVDNFVAQFGLHGDTAVSHAWRARRIDDDTVKRSNVRGKGPAQGRILAEGNAYRMGEFPLLDYIITARITREWRHR